METVRKKFLRVLEDDTYGMICAPTDPELGFNVLTDYLLPEGWYTASGGGAWQVNTEIVYEILNKYSKDFRRDIREAKATWNVSRTCRCPHCGGSGISVVRIASARLPWWYFLECENCHYRGKTKLLLSRAVKAWKKGAKENG